MTDNSISVFNNKLKNLEWIKFIFENHNFKDY